MKTLNEIHTVITTINEDPLVQISKKDDYTFKIIILGDLMSSFEKLGEIQTKIIESCKDEYDLKTIYGDRQDATLILEKNQ